MANNSDNASSDPINIHIDGGTEREKPIRRYSGESAMDTPKYLLTKLGDFQTYSGVVNN